MAELWYNDAGTWRKNREVWYNDAGTWRSAKELWYNDAGTWKKVFSPGFSAFYMAGRALYGTAETEPGFEEIGACYMSWLPNGQLAYAETDAGVYTTEVRPANEWASPVDASNLAGAAYEMYLTIISQSGTGYVGYSNVALNTWSGMGSTITVEVTGNVANAVDKYVNFNVKIRKIGTTTNLIDTNFSLKGDSVRVF